MNRQRQEIRFRVFKGQNLQDLLGLAAPPFTDNQNAFQQLRYVQGYVGDLGCQALLIELHYIDRDYMEDHSVFYSKSLQPYPNSCRRVHFFSCSVAETKRELKRLRETRDAKEFHSQANEFSEKAYIGFSVIKPLPGCPVGRTVLRCFPEDVAKERGHVRKFFPASEYLAHLLGIPLRIRGLAFQQQDVGVSACATTALWAALQRTRAMEEGTVATPAQITIRASQFTSPFGRSMPSEGLSIDQMCQAVHSLGYSPNLFRADSFDVSRALLYSAVLSGISPVLILVSADGQSAHAVATAGMKQKRKHPESKANPLIDNRSSDMLAIYIHDDRLGPYLKAELKRRGKRTSVHLPLRDSGVAEDWFLSHVLIPMHNKIRISFGELERASVLLVQYVHIFRESVIGEEPMSTSYDSWIAKSHSYVESLILGVSRLPEAIVERLSASIPFSRYLGVVRIRAADLDPIDVLLDTTSTEKNLQCLAIVAGSKTLRNTDALVELLSEQFECPAII